METIKSPEDMQKICLDLRTQGLSVGFVPSMGALHEGHLSLIRASLSENDKTIVSIFVNPSQFAPTEDLSRYPRPIAEDKEKLEGLGVDWLFLPTNETMYPLGFRSNVEVEGITKALCGLSRPNHFKGVTTICTKLFLITLPRISYFGQKDYQQSLVIRCLVKDLNIPMELKVLPIVREPDGLAMSSRNIHLSADERKDALRLHESLEQAKSLIQSGVRDYQAIKRAMTEHILKGEHAKIDYISLCSPETLEELTHPFTGKILAAVAVFIGATRLIDNAIIDLEVIE